MCGGLPRAVVVRAFDVFIEHNEHAMCSMISALHPHKLEIIVGILSANLCNSVTRQTIEHCSNACL